MHIPTPTELKARRIALGLKQADVAARAGISQSMVARIEAGSVDPRLSTLTKIVQVLNTAERPALTASDVMHSPVVGVAPRDAIQDAVRLMQDRMVAYLPVLENGVPVGCISESSIVGAMGREGLRGRSRGAVRDFMEPCAPTIPQDTDIETVIHILQQHHAVLVVKKAEVIGVITRRDLIALLL
ncbi:MAG: CBS domain-containing protein [Methanomicrobiales archaeon]|nr:CBS domain-containing protein [Methanomicrobiales archaeon]MDI6877558.1 CBS domain-containing protein [Methanomicrobiales archaeon]